jgi:hypothetical protein
VKGRALIWMAVVGNVAVMSASWSLYGWNLIGAHVAARNTARFSSLWFIVGFAAPGLSRWLPALPGFRIIHAFVAAHLVHFAAVAMMLAAFMPAHVSHDPMRAGAIIVIGSALVIAAGLTARPRSSSVLTAIHAALLAVLFLIFFLGFLKDPLKPVRGLVVLLALALVFRLGADFGFFRTRTKTQGQA